MGEVRGRSWVLLAAGSKGWTNYRHQANVCHVYQMVHRNGIPDEQIVVMMYDDIAHNEENPRPGEVINEPNGINVYPRVLRDYTEEEASAQNFLAVLRGNEEAVLKQSGGAKKVLKSDEHDTVFIYLSDHGAAGVFAFPNDFLHASDLVGTITEMARHQQFSKMVIYMESCCSGSMLEFLPKNIQVYGVTASAANESHSACFYDEDRHTFLAGEFTSCWLFHNQISDLTRTTFQDQFVYLQQKVTQSTPCQYGNNELSKLHISDFLGMFEPKTKTSHVSSSAALNLTHLTPCHEVPLIIQRGKIQRESDPKKKKTLKRDYDQLLQLRSRIKKAVQDIAHLACPDGDLTALTERCKLTQLVDLKDVAEHFRQAFSHWHEDQRDVFVLSQMQIFVNLFELGVEVSRIKDAITDVSSLQGSS